MAAEIGAGFKIVPMFVENGEEIKVLSLLASLVQKQSLLALQVQKYKY